MREIDLSANFSLPKELLFQLLFKASDFQRRYHSEITGSADVVVTPWSLGLREVSYTKKLNLPKPLLAVLGDLAEIAVVESQSLSDASVFSRPVSHGLERFKTTVAQTVTSDEEAPENGCKLRTVIRCEAPCILGFQSLLERQMESVARDSLTAMYAFAEVYLQQVQHTLDAPLPAAKAKPADELMVVLVKPPMEPPLAEAVCAPLPQPLMRASSLKRRRDDVGDAAGAHELPPAATQPRRLLRSAGHRI
jgi:hypothetical protein